MSFRITALWAWTMIGEDDEEGILGFLGASGVWIPLIASDRVRLDQLREHAERIVKMTGRPACLRRFDAPDTLDRIEP